MIRFASSRCCSSACGIARRSRSRASRTNRSLERSAAARRRPRPASSAGLPWRVSTTERARSYANEAACPPAVPTSRSVTAADPVGPFALSRSVATVRAPPPDQRSAVPWNCRGVPVMPLPGAVPVSIPEVPLDDVAAVRPQAEQRGEPRVRPHRDQVAAALHPGAEGGGLGVAHARSARAPRRDTGRAAARRARSCPRRRTRSGPRRGGSPRSSRRSRRRPRRAPGRPDRSRAPGRQRVRRWRARRRHRRARCGDGSPCADNGASRAAFARRSATGSFCYAGKRPTRRGRRARARASRPRRGTAGARRSRTPCACRSRGR